MQAKRNLQSKYSGGRIFWAYYTPCPLLVLILPPCSINFHLEINNPEETSKLEADFAEEVKKRGEDFKYYKDQVFIPCK